MIVQSVADMIVYPVGVKQKIRGNPQYPCHPRAIKKNDISLDFNHFSYYF